MAIARNTSSALGLDTGLSGAVATVSYTCGSGSNRKLFFGCFGRASNDNITSCTYNGVPMTELGHLRNASDRDAWFFGLNAPASGAHDIVITWDSAPDHYEAFAVDFDGSDQTVLVDDSDQVQGNSPVSRTLTVAAANSWVVAFCREGFGVSVTWTNATSLQAENGGHLADSNGPVAAGSYTVTCDDGFGLGNVLFAVCFSPVVSDPALDPALQMFPAMTPIPYTVVPY